MIMDLHNYDEVIKAVGKYSRNLAVELGNAQWCGLIESPGEVFAGSEWRDAEGRIRLEYKRLGYKALLAFKVKDFAVARRKAETLFAEWEGNPDDDERKRRYRKAEEEYTAVANDINELGAFIEACWGENETRCPAEVA